MHMLLICYDTFCNCRFRLASYALQVHKVLSSWHIWTFCLNLYCGIICEFNWATHWDISKEFSEHLRESFLTCDNILSSKLGCFLLFVCLTKRNDFQFHGKTLFTKSSLSFSSALSSSLLMRWRTVGVQWMFNCFLWPFQWHVLPESNCEILFCSLLCCQARNLCQSIGTGHVCFISVKNYHHYKSFFSVKYSLHVDQFFIWVITNV